jgi:hypothetical protein
MKNFLLSTAFLICLIVIGLQFRANKSLKMENEEFSKLPTQNVYITKVDTVHLEGKTIFKYKPQEGVLPVSDYVSKSLADTLVKALGIAKNKAEFFEKRARSYEAYTIVLRDSLIGTTYTDSKNQKWAHLKDKTFDIKYNVDSNIWIPQVSLTAQRLVYNDRKNIFHPYHYNAALFFDDERIKISNIQDYTRIKQPSRWGISVFGGPLVSRQGFSYGVGIGATYDIISF